MMSFIDFHSHVLPSVDHGSSSVETSIFQLKSAMKCGVSKVVATPHFYPQKENPDVFLARRAYAYNKLMRSGAELPEIILGAEILICENIEEMPMLSELCIGDSNTLLIELPFTDFYQSYVTSIAQIISKGYRVILAHVDRYDPNDIEKLLEVGALAQINADALATVGIRSTIKKWIDRGVVYAIGSDIHGRDKKAYKKLVKAYKKIKGNADAVLKRTEEIIQKKAKATND